MRFSDPLDEAAALADSLNEASIAAARRHNAPEQHPDFDGECCVSCGDEIPDKRLKLGKIRCVDCQARKEQQDKLKGNPSWTNPWSEID